MPAAGGTGSFVPDCAGCWGHLCFGESSVTPWKLLTGMGLGGQAQQLASSSTAFHWRTKSALGTFTQPHSISREVGAGLAPVAGTEHRVTSSARLSCPHRAGAEPVPGLCFSGPGQGHCAFGGRRRRPWASAIALGVKIRSVWPLPATSGALWLVGRRELWGTGGWWAAWKPLASPAKHGAGEDTASTV